MRKGVDAAIRFWAKVEKTPTCWLWMGARNPTGHGRFAPHHKNVPAHRYSYEFFHGPIAEGLEIDHLCRVPACVNPAHLEPVTRRVNQLRGTAPWALNARKTHCIRGHEFTPENTYWFREGRSRSCRACAHERYLAKKAA